MKKVIVILLLSVMLVGCSCDNKEDVTVDTESVITESSEETEEDSCSTEVGIEDTTSENDSIADNIVNEVTKEDVIIDTEVSTEELEEVDTEDNTSESTSITDNVVDEVIVVDKIEEVETEVVTKEDLIPVGKQVYKVYVERKIPDYIPQGDLNDNQYTVLNEILEIVRTSQEDKVTVPTLLYGTVEDAWYLLGIIENYMGAKVNYDRISRCDETGNTRNFEHANYTKIVINPIKTREGIKEAIDKYDVVLKSIDKAGIYDGMSEREAVHNMTWWIATHMTYVINNGYAHVGFTTGKGQCCTYAMMFDEMCEALGIECEYVVGDAGGLHAWNRVRIGDSWYWVDVTWFDDINDCFDEEYSLSETLWASHRVQYTE